MGSTLAIDALKGKQHLQLLAFRIAFLHSACYPHWIPQDSFGLFFWFGIRITLVAELEAPYQVITPNLSGCGWDRLLLLLPMATTTRRSRAAPGGSSKKKSKQSSVPEPAEQPELASGASIPVPPSEVQDGWEEPMETRESEARGTDPWDDKDPWQSYMRNKSCESGGRDVRKPTRDDFDAFCQWWKVHSNTESAETQSAPPSLDATRSQGNDSGVQDHVDHQRQRRSSRASAGAFGNHHGQGRRYRECHGEPPREPHRDRARAPRSEHGQGRRSDECPGDPPGGPHRDPSEPSEGNGRKKKDKDDKKREGADPPHHGGPPDDDDEPDPGNSDGDDSPSEESSVRTSEVRSLLHRRMKKMERPKSSLGSVKVEEFAGDRAKYQSWKKVVLAQQQLYKLEEAELSMLVYISCRREARDVLDQITIDEMVAPRGLTKMWNLLDEAYNETSEEHFERLEGEFSSYRRTPGQSIPTYLSQIKRLKMEYQREDPESRMSDRAWAQRLLVRASLTKRERMDVFFSAGGHYVAKDIERALRHRCQRIHEEERRLPQPMRKPFRPPSSRSSTTTTSSTSTWKSRPRKGGSYVASIEEEEIGAEDDADEEDFERDPEAYEAFVQEQGEERENGEEEAEEGDGTEEEPFTAKELKEAWAAGWRAKDKVNEKKKGRNFRNPSLKGGESQDQRKQSTTCSSCGMKGHWKGDPQCPKVKSGEDKPFTPKNKYPKGVHFVAYSKGEAQKPSPPVITPVGDGKKGTTVHEVNFTFAVSHPSSKKGRTRDRPPQQPCPRCSKMMDAEAKFCSSCGTSMALPPMTDKEKRGWQLVHETYDSSSGSEKGVSSRQTPAAAAAKDGARSEGYVYDPSGAREALEALPYMSRDEKKELYRRLQREEDENQRPLVPAPKTAVAPGRSRTTLQPPTSEMPAALKQKRLEEFRRDLFEERVDRKGRLRPSDAAPVPNEEQRTCPHPWNRLRWSANAQGHFARCRACDLKNVLYWHERHGSFMAGGEQDYLPKNGILAIADSGCRTAVGGEEWHHRFQQALTIIGLSWEEVPETEWFKFGAGEAVQSTKAYIYPVGIHGVCSYLRISEVGGDASDCPGLVGPSDMSRWKVVFRFETKQVDAMGVTRPMVLTSTRHPGLDLLDFGSQPDFNTAGLRVLKEQLAQHPHMFAFVTNQETDEDDQDQDTASEAHEFSSTVSDPEVWELVEDLNSLQLPLRDVKENEESPDEESGWSSTSHEFGKERDEETETDESEVEEPSHSNMAFFSKVGKLCTMSKGVKRKTRLHVNEIKEAMTCTKQVPRSPPMPKPVRPKEPFKVLEIFTWTMAVTMVAVSRGWIGQEPVTLPRWDLRKSEDRAEAFQYLVRSEPDLLVLAWPCTVWSPLQFLGHMTEERHHRLMVRQQEDRDSFLTLVHDMTKFQRSRGRAHLGENPFQSRAWKEPLIQAAYEGEGYGRVDMCRYGLRRPDTKELLKKPTRLAGTRTIVQYCEKACNCKSPHAHTVGSYKLNGKSFSLAEFAGGYTKSFAKKVVEGAELYLRNWTPDACTVYAVEEKGFPEEGLMDVDEEVPLQEPPDQEFHESGFDKSIWETVARVHQRLGHPTRDALVRMLKIAGAPKETLDCAKQFSCPVCESKAGFGLASYEGFLPPHKKRPKKKKCK